MQKQNPKDTSFHNAAISLNNQGEEQHIVVDKQSQSAQQI